MSTNNRLSFIDIYKGYRKDFFIIFSFVTLLGIYIQNFYVIISTDNTILFVTSIIYGLLINIVFISILKNNGIYEYNINKLFILIIVCNFIFTLAFFEMESMNKLKFETTSLLLLFLLEDNLMDSIYKKNVLIYIYKILVLCIYTFLTINTYVSIITTYEINFLFKSIYYLICIFPIIIIAAYSYSKKIYKTQILELISIISINSILIIDLYAENYILTKYCDFILIIVSIINIYRYNIFNSWISLDKNFKKEKIVNEVEDKYRKIISDFIHEDVLQDIITIKRKLELKNNNSDEIIILDDIIKKLRCEIEFYSDDFTVDIKNRMVNMVNTLKKNLNSSKFIEIFVDTGKINENKFEIIYKISRELITNSIKHSSGYSALLYIKLIDSTIYVILIDFGGSTYDVNTCMKKGKGLKLIVSELKKVNGEIAINQYLTNEIKKDVLSNFPIDDEEFVSTIVRMKN